jgi:hypothetical protein
MSFDLSSTATSEDTSSSGRAAAFSTETFQDVFELELECQRQFGDDHYAFYRPEYAGDFQLFTWRAFRSAQTATSRTHASCDPNEPILAFAIAIYENGEIVDFTKGAFDGSLSRFRRLLTAFVSCALRRPAF